MNAITNADKTVLQTAANLFQHGMCNKDILILYDTTGSGLLEGFEFKFNPNYASKIEIKKFYFLTPKEEIIGKQGQSISSKSQR